MANITASIITIGDELLIGQTIDTNSAWIAQQINKIGIQVIRRVAVGDEVAAITDALDEEISNADIVFITGGLGPTADDITKPLLCDYFGGKLVVNERVLEHIKQIFEKRKRPFLERNIKQAEVPDVCTMLFNQKGTAPGMLFKKGDVIIISMPGVPFEMQAIMDDEVMPYLKANYKSDAYIHRTILTAGEGESFIAEKIKDLEEALPAHIRLAYLPGAGLVKLRLTGKGADVDKLTAEIEANQKAIAERLDKIVVELQDIPLEKLLGLTLTAQNATLALAESCTGGYIGHHLTQVPGSGNYFKGSIVSYHNQVKEDVIGVKHATLEEHGAISEQTAVEMAEHVRTVMKSDYGFSVTGKLSEGGDDVNVPVGTVWMAVANKDRTVTRQLKVFHDRTRNKEIAVQMGMLMIWKCLVGKI